MKILIVSGSFFPEISPRSFRTTELAKEFARQGHQVKVIIPDKKQDYAEFQKNNPGLEVAQTWDLKWKSIQRKDRNVLDKILWKIRWLLIIFLEYPSIEWWVKMPRILKDEQDYDLLISVAVPHPIHWGIARCFRKKMPVARSWIADCGDPYMGVKTSMYKHPFYFRYFEKAFCRRADYISIPVESAKDSYYREFHPKIRIIPQAFNFDEVRLQEFKKSSTVRFAYAGAFYTTIRDPRPLLDALMETDLDFEFTVFTSQKEMLASYTEKLKEKLIIKEYIPRLDLIYYMSGMDFLVNLENGTSAQIPSKLIDYALSGRPILSLDSQRFDKQKLMGFLKGDYSKAFKIENIEYYNIKNATKAFIELTN